MRSFTLSVLAATLSALIPFTFAFPEGLGVEVTQTAENCDYKAAKGDFVKVHYRGTLLDSGNEFDASYNRGVPLDFQLGAGRVIKG